LLRGGGYRKDDSRRGVQDGGWESARLIAHVARPPVAAEQGFAAPTNITHMCSGAARNPETKTPETSRA
jgi:hypothetical protein